MSEPKSTLPGVPPEVLPIVEMFSAMLLGIDVRRSHATYAAHALQALIVANVRPGSMIDGGALVGDAWRFADAMLAAQQAREAAGEGEAEPDQSSLASILTRGSA